MHQNYQYKHVALNKKTHVVAVRILYESKRVVRDLVHELDTLVLRRMVNAALENAATMAVSGNLNAVGRNGIVNELSI